MTNLFLSIQFAQPIIHLQLIGSILVLLAMVHLIFPSYFDWKKDLASLQLVNRQLMYVHTFFIALVVLLVGLLCLVAAEELCTTTLGKKIAWGLALFWGLRLFFQFFVYSPKLWQGKAFETAIHIVFSFFWAYLTAVFVWTAVK